MYKALHGRCFGKGVELRKVIPISLVVLAACGLAGCKTTSYRSHGTYFAAPLEPGRTTFQRQRVADAPPAPGQTTFRGQQTFDAPPEPGQTTFQGQGNDGPPEPDQTSFE